VEATCLTYAELSDRISGDARLQALGAGLRQRRQEIARIETASEAIRRQYDSSLLEQIAGQPRSRSLNPVAAAEARRRLEADRARIVALRQQTEGLAGELLGHPASRRFLSFLNEPRAFAALERSHERAVFWFPSLQLLLQSLFLLPLLLGSLAVHRRAARRGHDLVALISWHLLVITLIPLLLKLLAFTQVGALFTLLAGWIRSRLGDLLFLISYLYILLIPLLGYGLIQLLQKVVLHPRLQAMARVQRGRCLRCARRLPPDSAHCPYCGTGQLQQCPACDRPTQRGLPHCRHCGHALISTSVSAFPPPGRPLA
jgi:RNA polymerase subunit RPABC4/transcription elongation factor Spt4